MDEKENKIKELTQQLEKGVEEVLTSDRYKDYLKQMSKFHSYSYSNCLLIFLQNENASLVAGYKTWQTQFNRNVNKGEKAIKIIAPCPVKIKKDVEFINSKGEKEVKTEEVVFPRFKAVNVFDISQTSGEPLTQLAEELKGDYKNFENLFNAIKKCSSFDIIMTNETLKEDAKGLCSIEDKTITIKEGMSQVQTIKTLLHEIAHEKLHTERNKTRNQEEIEAESIAFVVANYFGIDTSSYSFDYVFTWQEKDKAEVKNSFQTIQETSSSLIEDIKNNLALSKEKSIAGKIEKAKKQVCNEEPKPNKKREIAL